MVGELFRRTKMVQKTVLLVCLSFLIGCSPARRIAIGISVENVKNAEAMREISKNCQDTWPVLSGFIEGTIGSRMNELPYEVKEAKEALDRLSDLPELTDYETGLFLGLKIRLLNSVVRVTFEKYAPDLIEYLTLAF